MNKYSNLLLQWWRLIRGDRPVGFFLLLAPVLWSLWFATDGMPSAELLFIFIAGTWIMRSAGCVMNDIADRNIDPHVARTSARPLAAQLISVKDALLLLGLLLLFALILVLQTNYLTIILAPVALLLAAIYPFSKRWFHAPQLILALSFSWAIPMVYAASRNHLSNELWLLVAINILWVISYDTWYAMADRDNDRKINIHSTALTLGKYDIAFIISIQSIMILLLVLLGYYHKLGLFYYGGIVACMMLFIYQYYLGRTRHAERCFRAFINNAWLGMILFIAIASDLLITSLHSTN